MTPDLTVPDPELAESLAQVRIVRASFLDAAARAARWEPSPCPGLTEALERLAAMEPEP